MSVLLLDAFFWSVLAPEGMEVVSVTTGRSSAVAYEGVTSPDEWTVGIS
jgi:hypothetical protein